ncbi:kinase-like domain-containing protein [Mycena belliarum]|uniref:Kinase-like domain-containing protein n=1 Tax=Mycena belliarum TaxID=1033014 RepID=A0AAD6U2T9_9AGAR|nr:kinase-like domain-containing protein [Mycena belliae]
MDSEWAHLHATWTSAVSLISAGRTRRDCKTPVDTKSRHLSIAPLYTPRPHYYSTVQVRAPTLYCFAVVGARQYLRMLSFYDTLLTTIVITSWCYTLSTLFTMVWSKPLDAQDLAEHCFKYVINEDEVLHVQAINSGNAHVVSRAEYRGRAVVLKRWHGSILPDDSRVVFTKRLTRDLDRWLALNHPNIGPVIGLALRISNLPSLVAPFYSTVLNFLKEHPSTDVLNLMHGIAAGLSYLHSRHPAIVHGDLKGSTVFIGPDGAALLSDIGIAAIPQPPDWDFHGLDDVRWLAPEIMDPSLRPDERGDSNTSGTPDGVSSVTRESDVYAFGMLAYEMHARAPPFAAITWPPSVIIKVVAGGRPDRPSVTQGPQLTDALWDLVQLCWAHEWERRPSADTVLATISVLTRVRALEASCD